MAPRFLSISRSVNKVTCKVRDMFDMSNNTTLLKIRDFRQGKPRLKINSREAICTSIFFVKAEKRIYFEHNTKEDERVLGL